VAEGIQELMPEYYSSLKFSSRAPVPAALWHLCSLLSGADDRFLSSAFLQADENFFGVRPERTQNDLPA